MGAFLKWVYFAFFCVVLAACGTARINTQSEKESRTETISTKDAEFRLSTLQSQLFTESEFHKWIERTNAKFKIYDTNVVDADGSHPLLAEIEYNAEKEAEEEKQVTDTTSIKTEETASVKETEVKQEESKEETKVKVSAKNKLMNIFGYISVSIIFVLILKRYTKI